jgi:hypothetical protein
MTKTATADIIEVVDTPTPRSALRRRISASRFATPGASRNDWVATIESEHWDHILEPEFWAMVTHRLRIGDQIEVRTDDLTKWGWFVVSFVEASTGFVTLAEIMRKEWDKPTVAPDKTGQFYPHYAGLQDGWTVVRSEDGMTMAKHIRSQQEARSRIATEFAQAAKPSFG